jgi:ribosomal-protein-alanine N-acetyltransferase
MWTASPILTPVSARQEQIDKVFLDARQHLLGLFPDALVQHVGSTSLAPALTRGIIDIELGVDADQIDEADKRVAASGALRDMGMALKIYVRDRSVPSHRVRIRQTFAENPLLLGEFVGMQKQLACRLGKPYPRAKDHLFETLVQSPEFKATEQRAPVPYRIELETDRLRLVSALSIDAKEFASHRFLNREHHEKFAGKRPDEHYAAPMWKKRFAEEAIERWRRQGLTFLLRHKQDNQLIGACSFSGFVWGAFRTCNLGYQISQPYEGKGYMSEACTAAIDYVTSEWGVHRVQAVYDVSNTRSAKLAKRLGLHIEGTARNYINLDGVWHDGVMASLTQSPRS